MRERPEAVLCALGGRVRVKGEVLHKDRQIEVAGTIICNLSAAMSQACLYLHQGNRDAALSVLGVALCRASDLANWKTKEAA